jgi:tRNA (pseudouridine54-N1)-methyltransferase
MVGTELRYLNPDERSTGALLRNALVKAVEAERNDTVVEPSAELNSSPGIYVSNQSYEDVVKRCADKSEIIYLKEDGRYISDLNLDESGQDLTFVLGDDRGMTDEEEAILSKYSPIHVSLSPTILHADHCIILVHRELDVAKR